MSRRAYPTYPQNSTTSAHPTAGQPMQNFPGQSLQNVPGYPSQNVTGAGHLQNQYPGQGIGGPVITNAQPQNVVRPTGSSAIPAPPGQPIQNYYGQPGQNVPPSVSLASRVQQMQLGPQALPAAPHQFPPSSMTGPPPSQPLQQGNPPHSRGTQITSTGPPTQHPSTIGAPPLSTGPLSTAGVQQTPGTVRPSGQPLPTTQTSMLPPPPLAGQTYQAPTTVQSLPPPPTLGQSALTTSGQGRQLSSTMLPPPPTSTGQPSQAPVGAPPPTSVQTNQPSLMQGIPPLPSGGQPFPGHGVQPAPPPTQTSGQSSLGRGLPPPLTSGQIYQPSIGQGLPPPPSMGQAYQPSLGQGLPPPPSMGQAYQQSSGQGPPPPPTSGQSSLEQGAPPPPSAGQPRRAYPPAPVGLRTAPATGQQQPPPGPGQVPPGPGQIPPGTHGQVTLGAPPGGMEASDPNLRPVNVMECRNVLPTTPIVPPPAVLPANMSRFNPNHKVFCCTMNAVPATSGVLSKLKLPFAVHIHPYKDMPHNECPVIHPSIIIRCRMCRAYINPFVTFIDSRHWRCNLCYRPNTLPEDFDYNPQSGRHGDRSHRIELKRSSVEYVAPSEYMVRPPQPCVYYFVIDVSFNAIESGLLGVFCRTLLDNLDRLPGDARTMVGILTFDSSLHFYNLSSSLSQPQMLVVSDVDDVFLPTPDSLLASLKDSKELIRNLLEDLPKMFANNRCIKSAMGAALQAATKLLTPVGGRITVLQSSLPNIGPGALKYREVVPSSTKMNSLNMAPASDFYKKLALDCSSQQIAVDLFAFSGQFIDLVTMSCMSKFSSGQVFYYPDFHHTKAAPRMKFEKDFRRYLTRKIGFEAVMRVRCTDGLSLHTFHGNFFVRSTDLLSLPNVNPDHGYTMNISIDENLKEVSTVCFQAALLYTSSRGERRIRVHTLSLPVANQLAHIYARLNVQAIAGVLANMAIDRASSSSLGDAREALMNTVIDATKMYRSQFASSMQASQFNLPGCLQLLPLFIIALLKSPAFSLNSKVSFDGRTQAMNLIKSLPLDYLMCLVYPRLYALHMLTEKDIVEQDNGTQKVAPPILQLSAEKMTRYGIFLMDYGMGMYIWVSKEAPQELIQKIFEVAHFGAIPETMLSLPTLENESSTLVNKLVQQIRSSRQHWMPLRVIREDGPHRLLFVDKLVEDRTDYGTSYYELLTHMSRQIK